MASSSSTDTLSQCERLPDELLLRVLQDIMLGWDRLKWWRVVCGGSVGGGELSMTVPVRG